MLTQLQAVVEQTVEVESLPILLGWSARQRLLAQSPVAVAVEPLTSERPEPVEPVVLVRAEQQERTERTQLTTAQAVAVVVEVSAHQLRSVAQALTESL